MRYTQSYKEKMIKRMLGPTGQSATSLSRESGVSIPSHPIPAPLEREKKQMPNAFFTPTRYFEQTRFVELPLFRPTISSGGVTFFAHRDPSHGLTVNTGPFYPAV